MFEKSKPNSIDRGSITAWEASLVIYQGNLHSEHENTALMFPQTLETRGEKHSAINTVQ